MTKELTKELAVDIVDALRDGTVPAEGLEHIAVGLDEYIKAIKQELQETLGAVHIVPATPHLFIKNPKHLFAEFGQTLLGHRLTKEVQPGEPGRRGFGTVDELCRAVTERGYERFGSLGRIDLTIPILR